MEKKIILKKDGYSKGFILKQDDDIVRVEQYQGEAPTWRDFLYAIGKNFEEILDCGYAIGGEKMRVVERVGQSGCSDFYMETERIKGFPYRNFILHISMAGKINNGVRCHSYDLLVLLISMGWVDYTGNGGRPAPSRGLHDLVRQYEHDYRCLEFGPRDTDSEEGWTTGIPREVVVL